jgi:hypothetical protein
MTLAINILLALAALPPRAWYAPRSTARPCRPTAWSSSRAAW